MENKTNKWPLRSLACAVFACFSGSFAQAAENTSGHAMPSVEFNSAHELGVLIQKYQPLLAQRKYEEALPLIKTALELAAVRQGSNSYETVVLDYILALIDLGKEQEAVTVFSAIYDQQSASRVFGAAGQVLATNAAWGAVQAAALGSVFNPKAFLTEVAARAVLEGVGTKLFDKGTLELQFDALRKITLFFIEQGRYAEALPFARRLHSEFGRLDRLQELKKIHDLSMFGHGRLLVTLGFANLLYAATLSGVGEYEQALVALKDAMLYSTYLAPKPEGTADELEKDNPPGESYFNANSAILYNAYWPIKALLLSRGGREDEAEKIIGTKSALSPYWKQFIRADQLSRQGRYSEADRALTTIEPQLSNATVSRRFSLSADADSRQAYSHYTLSCGLKLKLANWKDATTVCAKAIDARERYWKKTVPTITDRDWVILSSWLFAIHDIAPETWSTPPTLYLALDMAKYYAGESNAFPAKLREFVEKEEARRDNSVAINSESANSAKFRTWAYKELMRIAVNDGKTDEAFRLSERTKAQTLIAAANHRDALSADVLPKAEQAKLQAYELRLADIEERLGSRELKDDERARLQSERDALLREYRAHKHQVVSAFPRFAELTQSQSPSAAEIRSIVPESAGFVSYVLHQDEVYALAWADGQVHSKNLGAMPGLAQDVSFLREYLSDPSAPNSKDSEAVARRLHQSLIAPLPPAVLAKQNLIVSPDGVLSLLPFEVLHDGSGYLIEKRDIAYVQSLSMLSVLQRRQQDYARIGNRQSMLAMGDPDYGNSGGAASRGAYRSAQTKLIRRVGSEALRKGELQWIALPGTKSEVDRLSGLFGNAMTYFGKNASEDALQSLRESKALSDFRILHFATHGYVNPDYPSLSSIVLTQTSKSAKADGYVTAAEWLGYDLRSDLVTLSACETGVGKIVEGEGVMGLPYALFSAGNTNTVMTLWSVADDSTSDFMVSFYGKISRGMPYPTALSETKREFLRHEEFRNPFFWAPFVLYGV